MATDIDKQIDVTDGKITQQEAEAPEYVPIYQVYPHTKVPVSKASGPMWEQRWREGLGVLDKLKAKDRWQEAINYYQNDQSSRSNKRRQLGEVSRASDKDPQYATENVVFTNVSALVPAVYAKNPDVEFTATDPKNETMAKLYEQLVRTLLRRKFAPGINLKPKLKRGVCTALLTNCVYLELKYNKKEDSSEEAFEELTRCSTALAEAKTSDEIQRAEGKLAAIDKKITMLSASGPECRIVMPQYVIRDPNGQEADLSDSNFLIVGEYIRTNYLRAVYGKRNDEDQVAKWESLYAPTHELGIQAGGGANAQGHDEDINNFSISSEPQELDVSQADEQGNNSKPEMAVSNKSLTLVWYVWDKTTRRVLMFHDKDWKYPIWVWDDPYKLSRFFPIFPLQFYTDPTDPYGRSEVMYYLDQQDEINMGNLEIARMKHWVMSKVFYDSNKVKNKQEMEKFLSNDTDEHIMALDLPEGSKIQDIIGTFPAPSGQFADMFSNNRSFEAINRMSSVTPIMQNIQFKTNTTNKAVESYESSTQERLDEKIDAIEDIVADLGWALVEMCSQFMGRDDVAQLVPEKLLEDAGGWEQLADPSSLIRDYNFAIVGGSTLKPTSRVKKEQAIQLGQTLGQFAQASPAIVLVMLKALERAFSEDFVVTDEEWQMLVQSVEQATQQQQQPPAQGQQSPAQGQSSQGGGGEAEQMMQQVEMMLQKLPPEVQGAVGEAIKQGVPLRKIMSDVMKMNKQGAQQAPQPN